MHATAYRRDKVGLKITTIANNVHEDNIGVKKGS